MYNIQPNAPDTTTLAPATATKIRNQSQMENRVRITIINNTGGDLRVSKGRGATAGVGTLLTPDGVLIDEPMTIITPQGWKSYLFMGEWWAYSVAGGDVDVMEEVV